MKNKNAFKDTDVLCFLKEILSEIFILFLYYGKKIKQIAFEMYILNHVRKIITFIF